MNDRVSSKSIVTFSTVYGGIISGLYLYGFWGTFEINVLEFVSFSDILKLAIFPLIGTMGLLLIATTVSQLTLIDVFPPGGGADTKTGRFGLQYWKFLIAFNLLLIISIGIFVPSPRNWYIIAYLVSFFSTALCHLNFFIIYIPNPKVRAVILYVLILGLGMSFYIGKLGSFEIKSGHARQIVDISRSNFPFKWNENNQVAYVGHLSDFFAFYESLTKRLILIKLKEDSPLILMENPNRG